MSAMTAEDFLNAIPNAMQRLAEEIDSHLIDSKIDQLSTQIRNKLGQFADASDLNSRYLDRISDAQIKDSICKGLDDFSQTTREAVATAKLEANDLLQASHFTQIYHPR